MSTIIMAECWPLGGMSPSQKAVLISLADQANDDGVCWPSIKTLTIRTCLSERAVRDALAWLQTAGIVFREYRANTSTSYTVRPKRFNPQKAPPASKRSGMRKDAPADAAPPANAAPGGANAAPPPANAAPLGGQMPPPNHQGNRHLTVNEPLPAASPPAAKVKAESVDAKETQLQAACRATWQAYCQAYEHRYGAMPVRNAAVNAKVKQFVQRIGYEESPAVAAFYVERVSERFVVSKCHEVGLLLSGAEGYRTQWATGQAMTSTRAQQADATQASFDAADEAMALIRARRGVVHAE